MLDAFSYLLCSKLCWHNRLVRSSGQVNQKWVVKACVSVPANGNKNGNKNLIS